MNYLLVWPHELLASGAATITGSRATELIESHELKESIEIPVGVVGGKLGSARILTCSADKIELKLHLTRDPPTSVPLVWIVGLSRPQTIKKVVQLAASLGVLEVHFVATQLMVPGYQSSKSLREKELQREIVNGLQQVGDTRLVPIYVHHKWRSFFYGEVERLIERFSGADCFVAHPDASQTISRSVVSKKNQVTIIAVGPEAGWTAQESERFAVLGFKNISFGNRIFRVEQALALFAGCFFSSYDLKF